jgi:hypothetical protein
LFRSARAYGDFRRHALPFVINLFANEPEEMRRQFINNFVRYICQIQWNYRNTLHERGLRSKEPFFGTETELLEFKHIVQNHRTLSVMDGTDPADADFKMNIDRLREWRVPEQPYKDIQVAIPQAHEALRQLERFCETCCERSIKPFQNPDQVMAEFMEFLTHVSRGCLFHLRNKEEIASNDFSAAVVHLKRNILDMRKAIVATIFMKYGGRIDPKLLKRLLAVRQEELSCGPLDAKKMHLYKDEVVELTNVFYLNGQ